MSMKKFAAIFLTVALLISSVLIPTIAADETETEAPANLALSATATATDYHGSHPVANINDGSTSTRWAPDTWKAEDLPVWMQLSWEEAVTFDTITVYEWASAGDRADGYTVSISDDGSAFTDIYFGNGIGTDGGSVCFNKHYTAKHLRITFTSVLEGVTDNPTITEFEVYKNVAETTDNLAMFATPSAISNYKDNTYDLHCGRLNDGILNNSNNATDRWTSLEWRASTLTTTPIWCQYEWSVPATFDTVKIFEWKANGVYRANEFRLSTSDDGVTFTDIYTGYGIGQELSIELSEIVTTKYLRVTFYSVLDGVSDMPCINEIEVYNYAADATLKGFIVDGVEGAINHGTSTVILSVDDVSDYSAVTPVVTVADGASYTPTGVQDLTSPVTYTITAKDGVTKRNYTVTLMDKTFITDAMLSDNGSSDVAAFGPTPSPYQYNYQRQELAAFLHFSLGTFNGNEWSDGTDPVSTFSLTTNIEADAYVKTIKDAGFKKLIVTAKHHDGFCIWDSKYTEYDIASTNYPGDVLEEVSAACTKYGIEMGLYLSPWDRNAESYGYYDQDGNPTDAENDYLDYNEYYINQLNEILGNEKYGCNGHFTEIWLDGAKGSGADAQEYDFVGFVQTMNNNEGIAAGYEDNPLLFGTSYGNVRWIGNELGVANEENWSKANGEYSSSTGLTLTYMGPKVEYKGTACAYGYKEGNYWVVPEVDARINSTWFWHENTKTPKTLEALKEMYLHSVGHNSALLLNVPLNDKGTLDTAMKNRVLEWGQNIQASFHDNNMLTGEGVIVSASTVRNNDIKFKPSNVADEDDSTYWAAEDGTKTASIYVDFGKSVIFDALTLEEDIRFGQRIEAFSVYYKNSAGVWIEFSSGTTIGGKRVILEKPVQAQEIRISFTGMTASDGTVATPVISHVGVYKATSDFAIGSAAPDGIDEYDSADTNTFSADGWDTVTDAGCIEGSYLEGTAGDVMNVSFSGTLAWLIGEKNTAETVLSVSIDGGEAQTVTIVGDSTEKAARIFETATLGTGDHTMTVTVVSGTAKIDALYVLDNDGAGMFDFEQSSYTVNEDMYFDVKIVRKGGTTGAKKVIVQDNPGSAVQSSYHTTSGIVLNFAEGETEKTVTLRTKRYTEETGTLSFSLEVVSYDETAIVTGFNNPAAVNIIDAESYSGGYLTSMKVASAPDKLVYRIGDTLDLTGLEILGTYASGDTRTLQADQYKVDTTRIEKVGPVPVTVSSVHDGRSTRFTILIFAVGDADKSGSIDITDLVAIAKGTAVEGDLDRDGKTSSSDQALLRQHLIGSLVIAGADSGAMTDVLNEVTWNAGQVDSYGNVSTASKAKHCVTDPISAKYIIFENNKNTVWTNITEYDEEGNCVLNATTGQSDTFLISNDVNTIYITKPGHTYRIMVRCKTSVSLTAADLLDQHGPAGIYAVDKLDATLYSGYTVVNRNATDDTTWNVVGDSITSASSYYFDGVVSATGYQGTAYGLAGSTIAVNEYSRTHINSTFGTSHEYTSMVERILAGDMNEADIWTVYGGTNDWYYGSALGSLGAKGAEFDNTTVYGALQSICEYILAQENSPRLVLVSPAYANRERAPKAEHTPSYEEIRKAFAGVAALYGVEHLDMWTACGINAENEAEMLKDGVHPTTAGGTLMANAITAQLTILGDLNSSDVVVVESLTLQYDDYYTIDAENISIAENNGCLTLDGKTLHADKLTDAPVPMMIDGVLTMVTVEKAKVNLVLVDGQSNARGVAGELDGVSPITPDKGNGYMWVSGGLQDMKTYIDGVVAAKTDNSSVGFYPALAAEWYALTGEKTVVISKGHDGAPIHFWSERGYTTSTVTEINNAIKAINDSGNYEIASAGYYWLQGESNMILTANPDWQEYEVYTTPSQYTQDFLPVHNAYIAAFETAGVDAFAGIIPARSNDCTKNINTVSEYAGPRAAQLFLANDYADIYMVSTLPDEWDQTSAEAYTFTSASGKTVSVSDIKSGLFAYNPVHYAQNGYNAIGLDAADNLYKALSGSKVTAFTLYGEDGVTEYAPGSQINAADNMRRTDTQNTFEANSAQLVAIPANLGDSCGMTMTVKNAAGSVVEGVIEHNGYIADVTKITEPLTLTVTVNGVSKTYTLVYKSSSVDLLTEVGWTFGGIDSDGTLQPSSGTTGYRCYSDAVYLNHLVVSSTNWGVNWTQVKVYDLEGNFIGEQDITKDTVYTARSDRSYRIYVANKSSSNSGTVEWILSDFAGFTMLDVSSTLAADYSSYNQMTSK